VPWAVQHHGQRVTRGAPRCRCQRRMAPLALCQHDLVHHQPRFSIRHAAPLRGVVRHWRIVNDRPPCWASWLGEQPGTPSASHPTRYVRRPCSLRQLRSAVQARVLRYAKPMVCVSVCCYVALLLSSAIACNKYRNGGATMHCASLRPRCPGPARRLQCAALI
jgi:hypothetical protein